MKRLPILLALATLVGCGYDIDTYTEDVLQLTCDKMEECDMFSEYFTYDDCMTIADVEDSGVEVLECEDYDSSAAQECTDLWADVSCDDFAAPAICADICSNY